MNPGWYPVSFGLLILFIVILNTGCGKDLGMKAHCLKTKGAIYMVDAQGTSLCAIPIGKEGFDE